MAPQIITARSIFFRQRALLRWYRAHGRHTIPWRHSITPYRVLVSEIMLQQTQVDRVIPYFTAWMKRWPTVQSLARAKRSDVIRAWAGLGYNRRVVYLHRAAQEIVEKGWFDVGAAPRGRPREREAASPMYPHPQTRAGTLPRPYDIAELAKHLRRLPGIGSYTAHALLAFAWNLPAPCVDVNVRRVLAYAIYKRPAIMKMPLAEVERLAARVIPPGQGRAWNSALMDYGALMFQARHVPRPYRPRPPQSKFANSSRFWRGRIVAALRGDVSESGKNTKKQKYTVLDGRPKLCHPLHRCTLVQLRRALAAHGTPPPLAPLLSALACDGVIAKRGARYALA